VKLNSSGGEADQVETAESATVNWTSKNPVCQLNLHCLATKVGSSSPATVYVTRSLMKGLDVDRLTFGGLEKSNANKGTRGGEVGEDSKRRLRETALRLLKGTGNKPSIFMKCELND
jgi:hypothetical protein